MIACYWVSISKESFIGAFRSCFGSIGVGMRSLVIEFGGLGILWWLLGESGLAWEESKVWIAFLEIVPTVVEFEQFSGFPHRKSSI